MKVFQREQEERGQSSLFDSVTFIILLFGLPVPFVLLVTALHQFAMSYPLYVVFGAYGLLVTSFVEAATKVIRWTANTIVSKHDSEGTLMTPLVFVLFPQWILFLYTILNSLDCDAMDHQATPNGEMDAGTIALSAMMTIGIPLLTLVRAFRQAWKEIDEEEQRQKLNRKTDEPARNFIALSRNVHSKRFNGVTSCLKLL
eukprot:CAMPEP_0113608326 /NCGR_PEP_ID=MMETSP0017_2-20120614/3864_1 /TAXON_ID=2856 /ORGANISM="Cylindrotheca closterium" /LENGTH=199 /DNA_ID=CAMNT_0000517001 /DNA_START=1 /DNA_END=600 /DNA_ORIENTATION=+ /assembly_acc=CAM_ASM_000147